ncbi:3'-5' exonuclease [candidate division WWE3 bacterium CG09_land_8_20_14_0_10_47_33]|uniref:3'-5' exonuclease n=1 Tax=candidate division WWE3 bacterium CG_4_9_14_0_2_um_filter_48_10 TaxID=1975078 RepID=A0A2M8EHU6_UNCKA|nr:MAG: 3'-5' exonuclease [candidate division WWE3 bacterium CG09_land_8_20_14_0_10_47_33]PIZ40721.1 MAG: 3'-5' exonuclease [candidate division WWE3 bacterium CG_4_10_14_0_2_um_filter_47_8]PJC21844.1 MAG: 3'-5' exonuclease [candidate division WWE3 bacterium CG_4_9_14_0_2_um_filter_48_10]PJE52351.1 MAG: DNA polymerase III subunit epsilon [candidate division WWE3 bacterium CG10_big_fil_rev_8_21_14_0_10_48_23]
MPQVRKIPGSNLPTDFRNQNLLFIDLETTGLDPTRHEIIEIGAILVSGKTLKIEKEYQTRVKPEHPETADKKALKLSGLSPTSWKKAKPLIQVLKELNKLAPGAMLVGHNITFDWTFLEIAYRNAGISWTFDYHRLDVLSIAYAYALNDPKIKRLRLQALAEHFSIKGGKKHRALGDARTAYKIFLKLVHP